MKRMIKELFLLRSVACLSILLLHILDKVYPESGAAIDGFKLLLTFGTPTFILISEFILASSYPDRTPNKFWGMRIKYILLPYLAFAFLYAAEQAARNPHTWKSVLAERIVKNLFLGEFPGYFILIIFQFYLLHIVYQKWLRPFPPALVLAASAAVNFMYLGFFNFVKPLPIPHAGYIWDQLYWFPFTGWIFYFTIAYYCGRNYEAFTQTIIHWTKWLVPLTVITGALSVFLFERKMIEQLSSKRVDIVLFTLCLALLLFSLSARMEKIPIFFIRISQYSFGIYLLHPLLLRFFYPRLESLPGMSHHPVGVVLLFAGCILICIPVKYFLNRLRWGAFIIGKIGYTGDLIKPVPSSKPAERVA